MEKIIIFTDQAPKPIGPYSQAVMIQNTLYVSGQIALNPASNEMVNADIKTETRQVMKNIQNILMAANLTFTNVVKCTIFIKDMNAFAQVNEVYGEFFSEKPPARETVEVSRLPKNANVEISCVAVVL